MSQWRLTVPFVKACACGNDFLLIERASAPANLSDFTRRICDRHEGVGADGVEWMFSDASADIAVQLLNADGSEAEISGNGTRCVAAYICADRDKEKITVLTAAGLKTCVLTARSESDYEFEVAMGSGQVGEAFSVKVAEREIRGTPVSMGNPHFVIFVREFEDNWQAQAAAVQGHLQRSHFRQGVNVEMVRIDDRHEVSARFFERGVGETRSSGTGSCAAALVAIASAGAESPVRVQAPGGTQTVHVSGDQVFLRGSARLVCRGEFYL